LTVLFGNVIDFGFCYWMYSISDASIVFQFYAKPIQITLLLI